MADKSGNMDRIKAKRWQNTTNNIWSNFYEEIIRSRDTGIVCLWSHGFAVLFVHEAKKENCGHVGIYGDANNFSFIAPPHGRDKAGSNNWQKYTTDTRLWCRNEGAEWKLPWYVETVPAKDDGFIAQNRNKSCIFATPENLRVKQNDEER